MDVFSIQGTDPLSKVKLTRSRGTGKIEKYFCKQLKSYVALLQGDVASTKIELPKSHKDTLYLTQVCIYYLLI